MNSLNSLDVPILLIMFNRPGHAQQLFDRVKKVYPTKLYIAIDGPRVGHPTDSQNVAACKALVDTIDWPCTVIRLYRDNNLGCKRAVSSAINWFFDHVEYGIILEDDCLPNISFFKFCQDLLVLYKDDGRVMHIGGSNLAPEQRWSPDSYIFTRICHIWGWATWKRAWTHYDVDMVTFPADIKTGFIEHQVSDEESVKYWKYVFAEAYSKQVDTWDYQWVYAIWKQKGLCVLPEHNLITNIGFDSSATHTTIDSPYANMITTDINSIRHPAQVEEHIIATAWLFKTLYRLPTQMDTFRSVLKRRLRLLKKLFI